jgi:FAD/FMN-containing dehydrogenase
MTHQSVWGSRRSACALMAEVKRRFDPKNVLNPGRFVYP